ncbi:MAG: hypothetical protein SXQ77_04040, partial [Halobacteria archaeon]|nr:hypothetical protein [Halobacteria archaeon]
MKKAKTRVKPPGEAFPGVDQTLMETQGVTRESVLYFEWMEDGSLSLVYRLSADDPSTVTDALDDDETVIDYEIIEMGEGSLYVFIHAMRTELMAELLSIVDDIPVVYHGPYRWTDEGVEITLAGNVEDIQKAYDRATQH